MGKLILTFIDSELNRSVLSGRFYCSLRITFIVVSSSSVYSDLLNQQNLPSLKKISKVVFKTHNSYPNL
jgi:hypothetical protein